MYRQAIEKLKKWKDAPHRRPLVIEGARQVGKTWLMKEFGKTSFDDYLYVNFDSSPVLENLFSSDISPAKIIRGLEIFGGKKIIPGGTLLIFDEIQEVPRALASLKYFCEDAPEYHIVCAGSLLGIALHSGVSFPVGKVEFLKLYPMSFTEYLLATGSSGLASVLTDCDTQLFLSMHPLLTEKLKEYYFVGGMPEVVSCFVSQHNFGAVREIQKRILSAYEQDFSKHAPSDVIPRIRMVWNSIPSQLARENRKFVYGLIREGSRAKDYETAIMWLCDCGLVHRVGRVNSGETPLCAYEDLRSFKLYLLDVGLLGCMTNLNVRTLLEGDSLFVEFKGALTEQYVLQEMKASDMLCYYYTNDRGSCEVDFVTSTEKYSVVPVEVKAETNLKAKSLKMFREKYGIPMAVRSSLAGFCTEENLLNLPLWAVCRMKELCDK